MKKTNQKNTYGCTLSNLFIGCRAQGFFDFYFLFMFQRFYSVTNQLAIGPMKMLIKTLNFICLKGVKDAKPEI
jgi:hypothetical protein